MTHHLLECIYSSEKYRLGSAFGGAPVKAENPIYTPQLGQRQGQSLTMDRGQAKLGGKEKDHVKDSILEYIKREGVKTKNGVHIDNLERAMSLEGINMEQIKNGILL